MSGIVGETGSKSGIVSPSWISLSSYLQTHFTQASSTNYPVRYNKVGELVNLDGYVAKAATDNTTILSGIPTEIRPISPIIAYQQCRYDGTVNRGVVVYIHYNGNIGYAHSGGGYAASWIPLNCIYSV